MCAVRSAFIAQTYAAHQQRRYGAMAVLRNECILWQRLLTIDGYSMVFQSDNVSQSAHKSESTSDDKTPRLVYIRTVFTDIPRKKHVPVDFSSYIFDLLNTSNK
jgi:hypothetical protein